MNQPDPIALASKAAALMEQFERRCAELEQQQRQLAQQLQQVAQSLPAVVARSAQETLQRVPDTLIGRVQTSLDPPVAGFEKRLQHAGTSLGDGAQALAAQLKRMERLQHSLLWKMVAVTGASLLLLLAGGAWLLGHYRQEISDNQVRAELMRAYSQADVAMCEGRLCANVDAKGPVYGARGQYRPVRARAQ